MTPRTASPAATVLVVDDDQPLRSLLGVILEDAGFRVEFATDGDALLPMVRRYHPSVVLLDMKMERVSGMEALAALRSAGEEVGVIVLSAAGDDGLIVAALKAGADDYITKPFLVRMLLARLHAVLKRTAPIAPRAETRAASGPVALDGLTHHATVDGRRVPLSPTEYALLSTLIRGPGRAFSTEELLTLVWGQEYVGRDEIVRANIYRLRRKLEPRPSQPRYILGRRGVGYYVAPQAAG